MKKILLLSFILLGSLYAESFDDFLKNDSSEYSAEKQKYTLHKKSLEAEFDTFQKVAQEEFNAFKKSLGKFWKEPKISTEKTWVEYSKDLKERKIVDFENNTITIDVHAKDAKEAQKALTVALAKTIQKDTAQAYEDDILDQRIERRLKRVQKTNIDAKPILVPLIFKSKPDTKTLVHYAKERVQSRSIQKLSSKIPQLNHYSITVALPKETTLKKASIYLSKVREMASRYKMPVSVVLAVIQTESGFNPMARSHIPAYGLMQIVPRSAGIDVYHFLYKKRRMLSPSYLYNSNNNIHLGTAYLYLIYSKYLKDIKDPQSRLYCTIASYNTGAGNVSRTFSGTNNPAKAAKKINTMSSSQVYNYLVSHLKYHETRNYLKNVTSRAQSFAKHYH